MNTASFLKRFECACGRIHECAIRDAAIGYQAIERAGEMLSGIAKVLIVSDGNTRPLGFARLTESLQAAGIAWTEMFFDQTEVLIPDERALNALESKVDAEVEALVGIGSGVISDLCKYVSFMHQLPYMIIATAPSMDGYASVGSALILDGMKVTKTAHVPAWIIGDLDVLRTAPLEMIQAGIGDILGKHSCLNDWKLASAITGEHMCQAIYDMVMAEVRQCEEDIEKCMLRDAEAVGRLTNSLVQVGVAMSYLGNSRPASGSEHHFSHFFEITGILKGRPYLPHGIDVAYSALVTASLREMLADASPESFVSAHDPALWEKRMEETYGALAPEVKALQARIGFYENDRLPVIREKWDDIRAILKEAPGRREMEALLKRAGYHMKEFVSFYGEDVIRTCIRDAKDLKDRYTLLWVLHDAGLLEQYAGRAELIAE